MLYSETFSNLVKAEIVGGDCFCSVDPGKKFREKIKVFSKLTGRTVYTLLLALVNDTYKVYTVDLRPPLLSAAAVEAFCTLLISKKTH